MNEPEISVLRFWSPLTADVYRHSVDYEQGFPPDYFTDRELVNHQAAIQAAIDDGWTESERQHGLWNRLNGFQLRERITDIHLSVKEYSGRLWAVAGVKAFSPLSKLEQNAVAGFLEMQYKEGWGCRFNQKAIPIEGNMELYIGFWSPVAFSIRSESEFMAGLVSSREDTLCFRDATASNQLSIWSVLSARFYYPPTDVWPDWESEWPENDEMCAIRIKLTRC